MAFLPKLHFDLVGCCCGGGGGGEEGLDLDLPLAGLGDDGRDLDCGLLSFVLSLDESQ